MQKSKSSKSKAQGPWSEFRWSEQYQRYYRTRLDRHGQPEYQWAEEQQTSHVPRSDHTINQLTEDVSNLTVGSSGHGQGYYSQGQSVSYPSQHATSADSTDFGLSTSPTYTHDAAHHGRRHGRKDKGKHIATDPSTSHGHVDQGDAYQSATSAYPSSSAYSTAYPSSYPSDDGTATISTDAAQQYPSAYYGDQNSRYSEQEAFMEAQRRSREQDAAEALRKHKERAYGHSQPGESSHVPSGIYSTASPGYSTSDSGSAYSGTYGPNTTGLTEEDTTPRGTPAPIAASSVPAPRTGSSYSNIYIHGTMGTEEPLDHRFKVEYSGRFQPGEVFKILWSEPLGQVPGLDDPSEIQSLSSPDGRFYVGFRRFIIVSTDDSHHSTCVPILTYDRRGCGKKGVKPDKHGIIYQEGHTPRTLKGEPYLGYNPVSLRIYAEGEKLAKESRVNYSKLVTIEHNVKVFFIGRISATDFETVRYAVNDCWEKKMQNPSGKKHRK
ncbi:hypothetical protein F5Y15DRAFT_212955 [Xylariaceae sp. FL0016]|nr:hypothetical protein F5Y15DRAFT_212955 [Xylariaceae sp. FL0016]